MGHAPKLKGESKMAYLYANPWETVTDLYKSILSISHRMFLLSLGTISFTSQEAINLIDRLIVEGQQAEEQGIARWQDIRTRQQEVTTNLTENLWQQTSLQIEDIQETLQTRFNIPNTADVAELNRQIGLLEKKLMRMHQVLAETNKGQVSQTNGTSNGQPIKPIALMEPTEPEPVLN